jgi:hypothetical protein
LKVCDSPWSDVSIQEEDILSTCELWLDKQQ